MARELLDTFEAAKAAADAAAAGGGPADVDRCVDALRQLRRMPVSMQDLRETQVGRSLRCLKKHPDARIQIVASDLLEFWKTVVLEESSKSDKKNGISDDRSVSRVEAKTERTDHINVDKTPRARSLKGDSPKVEKVNLLQVPKSETIKVEKNGGSTIEKTREIQGMPAMEKQASMTRKPPSIPNGPPKLTSLVKCNDLLRDKLRELLAEAFSKVSDETSKDNRDEVQNILDEVDACDPLRIAVMVESVLFEKLGRSNGAQKVKIRSIMFNLRDGNNPDLRRRVLLGRVQPERLIEMSAEEMASDERKLSNKQIKEKALFDCERGAAPKATTDQFKCGRCGQRKTTYYQLQTRSADEPMTTFVTCVNCNNHWKFC